MNILKLSGAMTLLMMSFAFFSCSTIPKGVVAVSPFDETRYLGKWYEIARFDFRFERNLNNTTAEYSKNENGTIKVINRGYDTLNLEWKKAEGKAKFAGDKNTAMLKVSFFGPFYSGYNVIALDEDYKYALVSGSSREYLWILARETTIPGEVRAKYLEIAQKAGFNTSELIWVEHNK
ncbi:MAG: lipocalin family protein [Bacteroidales bacterium]|nr:lipocalin family protein [Bacteroidales bacterium]